MCASLRACWAMWALWCLCCCISPAQAVKQPLVSTPQAGWCRTKHRPKKPAQSGHDGYCKACFRELFPGKHKAKQKNRKETCIFCDSVGELTQTGLCRPCVRARACDVCGAYNLDRDAHVCLDCCDHREKLGAVQPRLAMWCVDCTSASERSAQLCRPCFGRARGRCHHCTKVQELEHKVFHCAESACGCRMRFCAQCARVLGRPQKVLCKACWHAGGDICILCQTRPARHDLNYFRCCRPCATVFFCQVDMQ